MQEELALLEDSLWRDHYNRSNYEGSWSTLQLRSADGSMNNNTAIHAGASTVFKDTALMEQCPYIKAVVDFFKIEKTAVRLMKLNAGAVIKPHSDPGLNFEEGEVRIHVPVCTHPQLFFYLQEEQLVMEEGTAWYMNLSLQHSVQNKGETDRVHLVIDGIVNDWLKAYFNDPLHFKMEMEAPAAKDYSKDDKKKIIEQLRQMNTETGNRLADEMEASLQPLNS